MKVSKLVFGGARTRPGVRLRPQMNAIRYFPSCDLLAAATPL